MKSKDQIKAHRATTQRWLDLRTDAEMDGMLSPEQERQFAKEEGWEEALAWVLSDKGAE